MEEIREFTEALVSLEYELVSINKNGESSVIELENLVAEVEKIGIKEITDTYIEGIEFIDNNNATFELYAFC